LWIAHFGTSKGFIYLFHTALVSREKSGHESSTGISGDSGFNVKSLTSRFLFEEFEPNFRQDLAIIRLALCLDAHSFMSD
jgi:hypothetical protein